MNPDAFYLFTIQWKVQLALKAIICTWQFVPWNAAATSTLEVYFSIIQEDTIWVVHKNKNGSVASEVWKITIAIVQNAREMNMDSSKVKK